MSSTVSYIFQSELQRKQTRYDIKVKQSLRHMKLPLDSFENSKTAPKHLRNCVFLRQLKAKKMAGIVFHKQKLIKLILTLEIANNKMTQE